MITVVLSHLMAHGHHHHVFTMFCTVNRSGVATCIRTIIFHR